MSKRLFAIIALIPLSIITLYAVLDVGYLGIFDYQRHSSAGWQVFADLVIALLLVLLWLVPEARRAGHTVWPWVILTLLLGSFGPLLYLVRHGGDAHASNDQAAPGGHIAT